MTIENNQFNMAMAAGMVFLNHPDLSTNYLLRVEFSPQIAGRLMAELQSWSMEQDILEPVEAAERIAGWKALEEKIGRAILRRTHAGIQIQEAFTAYHQGELQRALLLAVRAAWLDPERLFNRGAASLIFKSLLGMKPPLPEERGIQLPMRDPITYRQLRQVEETLDAFIMRVTPVKGGESGNTIVRVSTIRGDYALRRVLSAEAETRQAVIERVINAGICVPSFLVLPEYRSGPGWVWWLDHWVQGSWLNFKNLDEDTGRAVLKDFRTQLYRLHSVPTGWFGRLADTAGGTGCQTLADWLDSADRQALPACYKGLLPDAFFNLFLAAGAYLRSGRPAGPVLCHGELSPTNLLVWNNRLTGIIDWENATGAEPAYDLAVFLQNIARPDDPAYERSIFENLLKVYRPGDAPMAFRLMAYRVLLLAWNADKIAGARGKEKLDELIQTLLGDDRLNFLKGY